MCDEYSANRNSKEGTVKNKNKYISGCTYLAKKNETLLNTIRVNRSIYIAGIVVTC